MALTEYRLQELARVSGVSARNIRAYRERGLLDPPRREGRSAYYDAYHLAQLRTINALLARGFTSAHIAEFFDTMRSGRSLAEFLGLQRSILRPRPTPARVEGPLVAIDPRSAEGRRLIESGLAQRSGAGLVFANEVLGRVFARAPDPRGYAQMVLELLDATSGSVESLATDAITALKRAVVERYGTTVPGPGNIDEMARLIADCAEFSREVIVGHVETALQQRLIAEISEFNETLMTSGEWQQREER
ncbi:MerR family transcriptional regulator [Mycobacterium sp. NPDC003323]